MSASWATYQHPAWWTDKLEREAQHAARKPWLTRCTTCGIVMRAGQARCGEDSDGHWQPTEAAS